MQSPTHHHLGTQPPAAARLDGRALVFGEVLFDHFPDGSRVLGGAPFNVAWHLSGLGCNPLLISAVGNETEGRELLQRMTDWGLTTDAVGKNTEYPTGRVEVEINDGQPAYRIPPHQAWDRIPEPELGPGKPTLFYHGTLALREPGALRRCLDLRARFEDVPVFVDLNLRKPWWTPEVVEQSLAGADWVKMSLEELTEITGNPTETAEQCDAAAHRVLEVHDVGRVLVTRGEEGAILVRRNARSLRVAAQAARDIVDTVGAGDAFAAVVCCGIAKGWTDQVGLDRASAFALDICRMRGATSADRTLYRAHLRP